MKATKPVGGRNIKVSIPLHKRLKIKSAKRGITIGQLVDDLDKKDSQK